ncbi:CemA family protein [bacterium]|nr:MAG: CemA family protein [bacterium]
MQKEAFEPTGLIPRSIIRTFDRFVQQLLPGTEKIAIQEYRVSRYQILVSIKSLCVLLCIPLLVNYTVKSFLLTPLTEHFWNSPQGEIFLNEYQEKRAFAEMQDFSDKIFFESLINDNVSGLQSEILFHKEKLHLQTEFQAKSLEIANTYNKQSILAITSLLGDLVTFLTVYLLFIGMKPQIIILKSFLTESIYSLSDTTKSFLLILGMDLLVGFHSPRGWEIVLENILRHFGLPENENFILLFVALFPVFLDTVFKYWIFRYLNKISPSTVVTYHSMLE